jgi:RND family efflux transporter MFP subunit
MTNSATPEKHSNHNTKFMKNAFYVSLISVLIYSCSGGTSGSGTQAELDSLLAVQAKVNQRIKELKTTLESGNDGKDASRLVTVEPVKQVEFRHFVEVQARVDGEQSVPVSPRSQGVVTGILVKEGDQVGKNQVLGTLDDQVIQQSLAEVQTQYEFAKNVYEKQKNLWDQKIGSELQYLTAKNNKESLEKRLALMNQQLDLTRLKAPVDGTIDYVSIKIGQAVMPGMQAFSIVNLSKLKVKGEVGESYSGKIKKGDDVVLHFPDLQLDVPAKVGYASRSINTLNRTFNVEVPLTGGSEGVSPNMIVVMKIVDYRKEDAIVLPVDMLQRTGEGHYVMAAMQESGKLIARRKTVAAGRIYNGKAEIISGLSPGDQVVTVGYRDLNDGQEIRTK